MLTLMMYKIRKLSSKCKVIFIYAFCFVIFFMGYTNVENVIIVHGAEWTIEMYKQHSFPN